MAKEEHGKDHEGHSSEEVRLSETGEMLKGTFVMNAASVPEDYEPPSVAIPYEHEASVDDSSPENTGSSD